MRKILKSRAFISLLSLLFILTVLFPPILPAINPQPEPPGIQVYIDGKALTLDTLPILENGRTLVPMRAIFEALGAAVEWNQSSQSVTSTKGNITLSLQIGNTIAQKNGINVPLDVPAKLYNNRTVVPLRFVGEALGANVAWNGETRVVTISSSLQNTTQTPPETTTPTTPDNAIQTPPAEPDAETPGTLVLPHLQTFQLRNFITLSDGRRGIKLTNGKIYPLIKPEEFDLLKKMTPKVPTVMPASLN